MGVDVDRVQVSCFDVRVLKLGRTVSIAPSGELDLSTLPQVETQIAEVLANSPGTLVIDLMRVTFLDSAAIRMLLGIDQLSVEGSFAFVLLPGPPAVQRAFAIAGVLDRLPLEGAGRTLN